MEGFSVPVEKNKPTNRGEKIEQAEISVRNMFDEKMETIGTITSFEHPRN